MSDLPSGAEIFDDAEAVAREAAESILRLVAGSGRKAICLSGGSTPERLYALLAGPDYIERVPWPDLHLFWGDERVVPVSDKDNNARMTLAAFGAAPIPDANIHRIPTEGVTATESASRYGSTLTDFRLSGASKGQTLFDVMLLGMGPDGHTASLFPGKPAIEETESWVVGVPEAGQPPQVPRVSLTLPALASARETLFLVTGQTKQAPLRAIAAGENLPASRVRSAGRLRWLLTRDAVPA